MRGLYYSLMEGIEASLVVWGHLRDCEVAHRYMRVREVTERTERQREGERDRERQRELEQALSQ